MKTTKAVDYGNCEEKVINGTQERRDERELLSGRGGESHWAGDWGSWFGSKGVHKRTWADLKERERNRIVDYPGVIQAAFPLVVFDFTLAEMTGRLV